MIVLKILAGLKEKFEPIKSQTLAGAELTYFIEAYARVCMLPPMNTWSDGPSVTNEYALYTNNNQADQFGARCSSRD